MCVYDRNFVVWGDHSSLLSNGFIVYTVKVLYTDKVFLTDEEYHLKTGKKVDVQSKVEQPEIYLFAHCHDSIDEKLSLIEVRREDVLEMRHPMQIDQITLFRFF